MTIGSIAGGITDLGGAVSDLFGAKGASASASSYSEAAAIAGQNEEIAKQATSIQETQLSRQIYQSLGTETADVAGAGMSASGSALDLLRSSQQQGSLSKAMAQIQGDITANAYGEQAGLYSGLAQAAGESATSQTLGGILSAGGSAVQLGSAAYSALAGGGTADIGASATASALQGADVLTAAGSTALPADAAAALGTDAAAGSGILDTLGTVAAVVAWVVCTELFVQGRMPSRWYATGARRFGLYDEQVKRGYYIWAIPAVRHLRAHPASLFSWLLERVFNHRAEFIAFQAGVRGARCTVRGWLALAGVFAFCWLLSRTIARRRFDWSVLYRSA